jgi:hypothetical protein
MPLLAQSIIGFEDRGRHQSGTRFHQRGYTERTAGAQGPGGIWRVIRRCARAGAWAHGALIEAMQ